MRIALCVPELMSSGVQSSGMTIRFRMTAFVSLSIIAVCVAGCGGGGSASPAPVATVAPTPVATATPISLFAAIPAPVGTPRAVAASIALAGDEVNVVSNAMEIQIADFPTPDEHQTYLRMSNGAIRFWLAGHAIAQLWTTTDFTNFTPTLNGSVVSPVLSPSNPLGSGFDADYVGPGAVFPAANGTDLLMLYHAENHYGHKPPPLAFYATIGLARSSDGGLTWTKNGAVISGNELQGSYPPPSVGIGAANPSVIVTNGFVYAFYAEEEVPNTGHNYMCVARAPVASDGASGAWMKFSGGSFSSPGLGGACTQPVVNPPIVPPATYTSAANPDISFNTALNAYVLVTQSDDGFYAYLSSDLMNWSPAVQVLKTPPRSMSMTTPGTPYYAYQTLITPANASEELTGGSGYLFYAKGIDSATTGQSMHSWYRQSFTIPGLSTLGAGRRPAR